MNVCHGRVQHLYNQSISISNSITGDLNTEENKLKIAMIREFVTNILVMCQKSRLRIAPNLKRNICKGCNVILVSGITAKIRLQSKNKTPLFNKKCLLCTYSTNYPQVNHKDVYVDKFTKLS